MSSIQNLQNKLQACQAQYDRTLEKLKALRNQIGFESDVSNRFKLQHEIEQVEADLDQLDRQVKKLEQKIQDITSGVASLSDVLKEEGLEAPDQPNPWTRRRVITFAGLGGVGIAAVTVYGALKNQGGSSSAPPIDNKSPNQVNNTLDSRFSGNWSTEGEVTGSHSMDLEGITVENGELNGTLKSTQFSTDSKGRKEAVVGTSGLLSVVGRGQGEAAKVTLYDTYGRAIAEGELKLENDNLVWRLIRGSNDLPNIAYLSKK
ncbi:hypothetical protein ACE1CI_33565 [Aerosakkonemataceae cyanobacterium BLCC-F50]|uniref:Effector-associated domain-containing protein n=1 Tax=Floridaenema flaviceps BLCC-F50 TaxID=3153642 RepID=A0ABV4Y1K0_9CYAN